MDPTSTCCPNRACPARGQRGQGNIGIQSRQAKRFICQQCHKTFPATKGPVFYRLRTSAEQVVIVITWLAHGCPLQAIVAAFRRDERTVADGWARAGQQGQAVQEYMVEHPRNLGHVQADASRVQTQGGIVWRALAMMVRTRWWLAGEVSAPRARPLIRRLLARRPLTLPHGLSLIGAVYNFCTPHASLSGIGSATTPAMATGITDLGWSVQELLSSHVPPPRWMPPKQRGRPSHALTRLRERWCGDHG